MTESATTTAATTTVQVHRVYIKATPQSVWDAITQPEWNRRYGYQTPSEYELRTGGAYRSFASEAMKEYGAPDVIIEGEILECEPPHRLVQTWRALFDPDMAAEGFTRLTYEIDEAYGLTRLTVTHDLEHAPKTAEQVAGNVAEAGGGWPLILSDLKTLLETGAPFTG